MDLEELFNDGADVEFQTGHIEGVPMIVIFNSGPIWSAMAATAEYNDLRLRVASSPSLSGERITLYEQDSFLSPLLTTDPHPDLLALSAHAKAGNPWILILQFKIGDEKKSVLWLTQGPEGTEKRTVKIQEAYVDRWIVED